MRADWAVWLMNGAADLSERLTAAVPEGGAGRSSGPEEMELPDGRRMLHFRNMSARDFVQWSRAKGIRGI
jgi:hypothetical protein